MSAMLPPVGLLRRYLRVQGWTRESTEIPQLDLFTKDDPEFGRVEIPVPLHGQVADANRRVIAGLRTLSGLEDKPLETVADEVRGVGFDQIEASLPVSPLRRNSIPLIDAQNFLTRTRTLLADTAAAEIEPGPDVPETGKGKPFVAACEFAHTFPSSFGFRILSPVGPHEEFELSETDHPPPFERRVVQRVARGMTTVRTAAEKQDPSLITRDSDRGFNAPACEDLARMLEGSHANHIVFRFVLSPEWLSSEGQFTRVELRPSMVPLIREAARSMKRRPDPERVEIRGRITDLHSNDIPADLLAPGGREITVLWESDAFGDVRVRVRVSAEDYLKAAPAHINGREVTIEGRFEPNTPRLRMTEVSRFEVS